MLSRWLKRIAWFTLVLVLVIVPTRLARGPRTVEALDRNLPASSSATQLSPAAVVIVTTGVAGLIALLFLRKNAE